MEDIVNEVNEFKVNSISNLLPTDRKNSEFIDTEKVIATSVKHDTYFKQATANAISIAKQRMYNNTPAVEERKLENARIIRNELERTPTEIPSIAPSRNLNIIKLFDSLGVNLDVQLSRNDTQNLLATLLTCDESQLISLKHNPRIPVAIKIVITRILDDAKVGNMEAIERIWTRIFGQSLQVQEPVSRDTYQGLIPSAPISREAYTLIRETLIGPFTND